MAAAPKIGRRDATLQCRLAKYGRREWGLISVLAVGLCAALAVLAWRRGWPWALPIVPVAALWGWVLWFFRDPDRAGPQEEGLLLSPADGRVTDVTEVGPDSPLGTDGVQVGIFMSIFDVHVNRSPCDGQVRGIAHHDGTFLDARDPRAWEHNEAATITMTHNAGGRERTVVIRQVAGLIARRIVTDLAEGQTVRRGQRIGMIKFGSRVELLVPAELVGEVRVGVGDRALGGQTVLIAAPKESDDAAGSESQTRAGGKAAQGADDP